MALGSYDEHVLTFGTSRGPGLCTHMSCNDLRVTQSPLTSPQVDGRYEDWMEVLRLMYHSGEYPAAPAGAPWGCMDIHHEHTVLVPPHISRFVTGSKLFHQVHQHGCHCTHEILISNTFAWACTCRRRHWTESLRAQRIFSLPHLPHRSPIQHADNLDVVQQGSGEDQAGALAF